MHYSFAEHGDYSKWLEVADNVGKIMRVPGMGSDFSFAEYAWRKLGQRNAILAGDNGECAGFIGFSTRNNSITWLGVKEKYRRQGIGSRLLTAALNELNTDRIITVNTYPKDYLPGLPARILYFKHGFIETEKESFIIDGLEMIELAIIPGRQAIQTEAI